MYLQAVVICCLAIAHSSLCDDNVHHVMNTVEIDMVFRSKADSVPKHELVPLVAEPTTKTYSAVDGQIIVGATERIWLKTFGANINLWLHPVEKVLIHENTPVYHANYSATEPGKVHFEEQHEAMKKIGQLYVDENHYASLVIGTDPSGKASVNGHIASHGLTVRSVPENVVKEYLRTRRSINETEYTKSKLTYVIVYETPKSIDGEISLHAFNRTNLRERTDRSIGLKEIPYTLYPQILVVVENSLYRKLGNDQTKLLEYLLAFWNGVDLKYRNLERPRIRLSISAIIIATEPRGTPYISDYPIGDEAFNATAALDEARNFFYNIKTTLALNTYDIVVTLTNKNLRGNGNDRTVGLAYVGFACQLQWHKVNGLAMVHDTAGFTGILTAAHELGHSFGMEHDNDKFVNCKNSDGYIMAADMSQIENSWKFSRCSLHDFDTLLHNGALKCLYNVPVITGKSLPETMPGKLLSPSDVCKANGFEDAIYVRSNPFSSLITINIDLCGNIVCRDKNGGSEMTQIPVPEGTPCGSDGKNMFCLRGRCTEIMTPAEENLRNNLGETARSLNCELKRLQCPRCKIEESECSVKPWPSIYNVFDDHM